uniref:Uncharacterized protein n=1 Tax=Panagrolaimus davidi TaxID=227884 RepID=A0A914PMU3_9BILA
MHRSDLSTQESDDEKHSQKTIATVLLKENVKKPKTEKLSPQFSSTEDKPESFFKNNPYFENIFKQNPRKRRQRLHRSNGTGETQTTQNSNLQPKKKSKSG